MLAIQRVREVLAQEKKRDKLISRARSIFSGMKSTTQYTVFNQFDLTRAEYAVIYSAILADYQNRHVAWSNATIRKFHIEVAQKYIIEHCGFYRSIDQWFVASQNSKRIVVMAFQTSDPAVMLEARFDGWFIYEGNNIDQILLRHYGLHMKDFQ